MQARQAVGPLPRWLFAPSAEIPITLPTRGRIVCNCHDIAVDQIDAAIAAGALTLGDLQSDLKCGTGCGACLPELTRILREPL